MVGRRLGTVAESHRLSTGRPGAGPRRQRTVAGGGRRGQTAAVVIGNGVGCPAAAGYTGNGSV